MTMTQNDIEKKLDEFIKMYKGKRVDFDWSYWYQCTDLSKKRASFLWIKPWSFNWAAKNANKNTFPWMDLLLPWPTVKLMPWDILQQTATKTNQYWHTGVVTKSTPTWYILFSQNNWNGNGDWKWSNACKFDTFTWWRWIVNIFRFKSN